MYIKFALITALSSVMFAVYLQKYHESTFNAITTKVTEFQSSVLKWMIRMDNPHKDSNINVVNDETKSSSQKENLYTVEELKKYDGTDGSLGLYLAVLGKVYDVGSGKKHYGPGGGYHFFTGRDGSRAFSTGEFTEEGLIDDIIGLTPQEVKSIAEWQKFYEKDYIYKGKLIGRYFDFNGKKTHYHNKVDAMIQVATWNEEHEKKEKIKFPPCNTEWDQENGSRVWCSEKSGGIERDWVGVPRQYYAPGSDSFRCACIKNTGADKTELDSARLKEYPKCKPDAISCQVFT